MKLDRGARPYLIAGIVLLSFLLASCTSNLPPIRPNKDLKNAKYYLVKKGDTLFAISWRATLDYQSLAQWNNIRPPYTIRVGQKIRLFPQKRPVRKYKAQYNIPKAKPAKRQQVILSKKKPRKTAAAKMSLPVSWIWPVRGVVAKNYPQTDNRGIVISAQRGRPVTASTKGKVVYSGNGLIGYGNLIIIKHDGDLLSAYGFNRQLFAEEGQWVKQGQKIAEVGSVAGNKPALHFEIRKKGKPVNPMLYLPK